MYCDDVVQPLNAFIDTTSCSLKLVSFPDNSLGWPESESQHCPSIFTYKPQHIGNGCFSVLTEGSLSAELCFPYNDLVVHLLYLQRTYGISIWLTLLSSSSVCLLWVNLLAITPDKFLKNLPERSNSSRSLSLSCLRNSGGATLPYASTNKDIALILLTKHTRLAVEDYPHC